MICLGIDTSNYTTSAALYDSSTGAFREKRRNLPVEQGGRGLRQSDAVFLHVKQLPEILEELLAEHMPGGGLFSLDGVGVSVRPRDTAGSYMPCFLAGELGARSAALARGIPLYRFSHQAGHIAAALVGAKRLDLLKQEFLAMHLSGGTTEVLLVRPGNEHPFDAAILCETLDLNAGQLIDRVGVMLGLSFPAGGGLEGLAAVGCISNKPNPAIKDGNCCLSGIENKCLAMLDKGESPADIALFCQMSVGAAAAEMAQTASRFHPGLPFLFAGGVIRNEMVRSMIAERVPQAILAPAELSSDNAVGIASLAALHHREGLPC